MASPLWAVEAGVRIRDCMTVTPKQAYWVIPNENIDELYTGVQGIQFIGKKRSGAAIEITSQKSNKI